MLQSGDATAEFAFFPFLLFLYVNFVQMLSEGLELDVVIVYDGALFSLSLRFKFLTQSSNLGAFCLKLHFADPHAVDESACLRKAVPHCNDTASGENHTVRRCCLIIEQANVSARIRTDSQALILTNDTTNGIWRHSGN